MHHCELIKSIMLVDENRNENIEFVEIKTNVMSSQGGLT